MKTDHKIELLITVLAVVTAIFGYSVVLKPF